MSEIKRILQWGMESGCLYISFPENMSPTEVDEVEDLLAIAVRGMRRIADARPASPEPPQ